MSCTSLEVTCSGTNQNFVFSDHSLAASPAYTAVRVHNDCAGFHKDVKEGDSVTVIMNEHVDYNGKQYPIASLPENLMSIIQAGGLVKAMRKLNGLD